MVFMNRKNVLTLIKKIEALPAEKINEVEDFVEFLGHKGTDRQLTRAAAKLSEKSFAKVWITPKMPSTTSFDFGDVLLVPFPFSNQTAVKKRPAVVVSSSAYNSSRPDLIILALTSQPVTSNAFGGQAFPIGKGQAF